MAKNQKDSRVPLLVAIVAAIGTIVVFIAVRRQRTTRITIMEEEPLGIG